MGPVVPVRPWGHGEHTARMRDPPVDMMIGDVDDGRKAVHDAIHDGIRSLQIDQPVLNSPFFVLFSKFCFAPQLASQEFFWAENRWNRHPAAPGV